MSVSSLTGWDRTHLQWSTSVAIDMLIKHEKEIERVAERFCNDDMGTAMADIFEKGLQEFLDMCDLDDRLTETETQMQNPANGIVTSYRGSI